MTRAKEHAPVSDSIRHFELCRRNTYRFTDSNYYFNKIGSRKAFSIIFFEKCRKKFLPSGYKFLKKKSNFSPIALHTKITLDSHSRGCKKVVSRFVWRNFIRGNFSTSFSGKNNLLKFFF